MCSADITVIEVLDSGISVPALELIRVLPIQIATILRKQFFKVFTSFFHIMPGFVGLCLACHPYTNLQVKRKLSVKST